MVVAARHILLLVPGATGAVPGPLAWQDDQPRIVLTKKGFRVHFGPLSFARSIISSASVLLMAVSCRRRRWTLQLVTKPMLDSAQRHRGNSERRVHAERGRNERGIGDVETFVKRIRLAVSRFVVDPSVLVADAVVDALGHPTTSEWVTESSWGEIESLCCQVAGWRGLQRTGAGHQP